uniref:Uncharacterized protein n=1 Tax=Polysiphonia elongata TaxID=159753 RepID=A0A1Z1MBX6_9FLOR|nr:hypothetical protein [Polysiphonia elongata]ARW63301.1 hypothetical protein [Polysiphonia elongata]
MIDQTFKLIFITKVRITSYINYINDLLYHLVFQAKILNN